MTNQTKIASAAKEIAFHFAGIPANSTKDIESILTRYFGQEDKQPAANVDEIAEKHSKKLTYDGKTVATMLDIIKQAVYEATAAETARADKAVLLNRDLILQLATETKRADEAESKWEQSADDHIKLMELDGFLKESESGEGHFDYCKRIKAKLDQLQADCAVMRESLKGLEKQLSAMFSSAVEIKGVHGMTIGSESYRVNFTGNFQGLVQDLFIKSSSANSGKALLDEVKNSKNVRLSALHCVAEVLKLNPNDEHLLRAHRVLSNNNIEGNSLNPIINQASI